jgi:hypothetical protein
LGSSNPPKSRFFKEGLYQQFFVVLSPFLKEVRGMINLPMSGRNFCQLPYRLPWWEGIKGREGNFNFFQTINSNALTFSPGAVLNT